MAEYYLISQLPSLDAIGDHSPLPITEERFHELCHRFLKKKAWNEIQNLTLTPKRTPEKSYSALVEQWNDGERKLRLALAALRAAKLNKPVEPEKSPLPEAILKVAASALEQADPMEAERFLSAYRLRFLETLRPADAFSEQFLFYYGLKLKLLLRMRAFDAARGKEAYHTIYHSILNGKQLEAIK